MKIAFIPIFVFFGIGAFSQTAPSHLQYFGFALVDVLWDDPHDADFTTNYITEVDSFSNIAQLGVYVPEDNIIERVQLMNSLCVKPLLSVQAIFFEYVDTIAPSGVNYNLRDNYFERWNTFKDINTAIFNVDNIGAFYIADEPTWTGITFEELNIVCELIQNDFPEIPIAFVEAYPVINDLIVPSSADWIGFDKYGVYNPDEDIDYLADLSLLKSKRSSPEQKIIIIIDDQWLPIYGWAGYAPADIEGMVQNYYELAASDTSIIGLIGYLWAGGLDDPEQLGVRNLPQIVIDKNAEIGWMIKQNNPSCLNTAITDNSELLYIPVFPNPANNTITIQLTAYPQLITIFNSTGTIILQDYIYSAKAININAYSAGVYFIKSDAIDCPVYSFIKY